MGEASYLVVKEILRQNPQIPCLIIAAHWLPCKRVDEYGENEVFDLPLERRDVLERMGLEFQILLNGLGQEDEEELVGKLALGTPDLLELLRARGPTGAMLTEVIEEAGGTNYLAVRSSVMMAGETLGHIPMLDYKCPKTSKNLQAIIDHLRAQEQRGYVVDSGNSYHFWGLALQSVNEWEDFMERGRAMPLVDQKYLRECRKRGYACLRITRTRDSRRKPVPKVVAIL